MIDTLANRLPPVAVGKIPAHRLAQSAGEILQRAPAEFAPQLRVVDGIAQIVSGAVRHEADQALMGTVRRARQLLVEDGADLPHDLDVAALSAAADIVGLAEPSLPKYE